MEKKPLSLGELLKQMERMTGGNPQPLMVSKKS